MISAQFFYAIVPIIEFAYLRKQLLAAFFLDSLRERTVGV